MSDDAGNLFVFWELLLTVGVFDYVKKIFLSQVTNSEISFDLFTLSGDIVSPKDVYVKLSCDGQIV